MNNSRLLRLAGVLGAGALVGRAGCDKTAQTGHNDQASSGPHGGTPVIVGSHHFHLELVIDKDAGKMLAFVMDDHMEKADRVPPTPFELVGRMDGKEHRATFHAGDGATAAATNVSMFSARADWLREARNFDGVIPAITLRAKTLTNVTFSYRKGSTHKH